MDALKILSLAQFADHLEARQHATVSSTAERGKTPHTPENAVNLQDWQDIARSIQHRTIASLEELAALARICHCARSWTADAIDGLREMLNEKLQNAVIEFAEHTNKADTELLVLHDQFIELERRGLILSQALSDDGDACDAAQEQLIRQQKHIVCKSRLLSPVSLAGHQALARMLLAWSQQIRPCDHDSDPGEDQLLWLLLCNLLGKEHAAALASDDPDTVLRALAMPRERSRVLSTTGVIAFPAQPLNS